MGRLVALLGHGKRPLWLVLAVGVLLFSPAIRAPFFLDDYLHIAMLEGTFPGAAARAPFDLYDFVGDDNRAQMLERGLLPWWTEPGLRIRFFRPLASALAWADHRVFGHHPLPMHLHSLAWWVLAVLAAHRLFSRLLGDRVDRRVIFVATAIFALAPCHALPLAWLANRETLVALAFGIAALDAHARFRDRGGLRHALLAALLFMLALLGGGEYATAFGGYVLALELVHKDSFARRILGVAPFAVPAAAYLAVRAHLGFGTAGSGFYTDPLHEPVAFLAQVPWRATALLSEGWLTFDVSTFVPGTARWVIAVLVIVSVLLLRKPVRRALTNLPEEPRKNVTWLFLGSLLAMTPVLAVVPAMRVLGAAVIGIAPIVAVVVEQAWVADATAPRSAAVDAGWFAALALGFAHLVHGPGSSFLASRIHRQDALQFQAHTAELRTLIGDPAKAEVVVVRGMAAATYFTPFALDSRGVTPARWCVLAHTGHTLVLRKGERSVEIVSATTSGIFPIGDGNLFRSELAPMRAGDEVTTTCLHAKVLEVGEHGPRSVRIDLSPDLAGGDTPVYVEETFEGWKPASLPQIGFGAPFDP
jgi:hypothetical protein